MATAKQQVRALRRAARRAIAAERDLAADGAAIAAHLGPLFDALDIGAGDDVTAYEPIPGEPDIAPICRALAARGARVLVPITLASYDLDWADLADPERTPLGLDAVAACPLLLIPGLSVDRAGNRLGQAGGCYDRTLPRSRPDAPVVTVLHPGEAPRRAVADRSVGCPGRRRRDGRRRDLVARGHPLSRIELHATRCSRVPEATITEAGLTRTTGHSDRGPRPDPPAPPHPAPPGHSSSCTESRRRDTARPRPAVPVGW